MDKPLAREMILAEKWQVAMIVIHLHFGNNVGTTYKRAPKWFGLYGIATFRNFSKLFKRFRLIECPDN